MRPIDADALMEKLNGIWDCNDMTFAPVDGCCIDADCKSCRWRETIEYVKRLVQNQPAASPWHRVEDELPDLFQFVVVRNDEGKHVVAQYVGYQTDSLTPWRIAYTMYDTDIYDEKECGPVRYWMPIEPPKEE